MPGYIPYCGLPPHPGELFGRFNFDPYLVLALAFCASAHLLVCGSRVQKRYAIAGWTVAAAAFISPICALSMALFSARVAQHMILILVAAPLVAMALPERSGAGVWPATLSFFALLWAWHMPAPYDATFRSTIVYWAMHVTLFGSAILLWHVLLNPHADRVGNVLAAGLATSIQMGVLGAVITFAGHAMYRWHIVTAGYWGMTPLADQQLGGVIMWVPGCLIFLWLALGSLAHTWHRLEGAPA